MSIITEAMRKAALRRDSSSAPSVSVARRGRTRTASVEPISSGQQYRTVQLDRSVPSASKILPNLTDRAARRAYKILRTRLLQRLEAKQWQSLAVTGTASGSGKTLTAVNLALAFAQDPNTSVFLVDLDLQRPNVAQTLGISVSKGLTDFLLGEASLDEIIYSTGIERFAVIPNARGVEQSSELLSGSRMREVFSFLEAETPRRLIVCDVPPLLVSDDVLTIAPEVDGMLLVATEGITPRATLEQAREVLADMNLLGVVLNRSSERDDSPYY